MDTISSEEIPSKRMTININITQDKGVDIFN
jgi:hypothetical protein